jgi:hypothetical protein
MFFTAMLITYIKGGTPAKKNLERVSAMTRATFVFFFPKVSKFYLIKDIISNCMHVIF